MTEADVTQAVKTAVSAVLVATAAAQAKREQVDEIKREILTTATYYADPKLIDRGRAPERIMDPKRDWMLRDDEHADYLATLNQWERQRGVKPDDMPDGHCPALVLETLQTRAEQCLIQCGLDMIGQSRDLQHVMFGDDRKRFISLLIGLVVNLPDFKHPLTGKAVA